MNDNFISDAGDLCPHITHDNFDYSTNISLDNKYIYVETPKVACSTIKVTLQKTERGEETGEEEKGHNNWHDRSASPLLKPSQIPDIKKFLLRDDIYKFCFVRNPYARLLSAYLNKIAGGKQQKKKLLLQLGYNPTDLSRNIEFDEFVDAVIQQPVSIMDRHWRTQYYQTFQDGIGYNFIGRFESFNEHFSHVLKVLFEERDAGISNDFRHMTGADDQVSNFYTKSLKDKVYDKFEIDFSYFGYQR